MQQILLAAGPALRLIICITTNLVVNERKEDFNVLF